MCVDNTGTCPRYYDPFTCPWCNHYNIERGIYPTVEYQNPYRKYYNGDEFQKIDDITVKVQLDSSSAAELAQQIKSNRDLSETIMVAIYSLPYSIVSLGFSIKWGIVQLIATPVVEAAVVSNKKDNVVIEWYQPYYKHIEVYQDVFDPSRKMTIVSVWSGNSISELHERRHWEAYRPWDMCELY